MVLASSWLVTSWSTVTLTSVMSSSALTFLATEVVQVYRTFLVGSKVDQYHLKSLKKVNYLAISFLCAMTHRTLEDGVQRTKLKKYKTARIKNEEIEKKLCPKTKIAPTSD